MKRSLLLLLIVVTPVLSYGCRSETGPTVTIQTAVATHTFTVEIAKTARERQQGLMGRESLGARHGMFFIFPSLVVAPFWMKNTPLSLDIIFINEDETIQKISTKTTPFSEERIFPEGPYRYVLEVLAGTAEQLSFQPGNTIHLPTQ